jgi:hypothetical protein
MINALYKDLPGFGNLAGNISSPARSIGPGRYY